MGQEEILLASGSNKNNHRGTENPEKTESITTKSTKNTKKISINRRRTQTDADFYISQEAQDLLARVWLRQTHRSDGFDSAF